MIAGFLEQGVLVKVGAAWRCVQELLERRSQQLGRSGAAAKLLQSDRRNIASGRAAHSV